MAPRYRGKRQLRMFRDKELASWSYYHFRIDNLHALRFLIQRLQTHCPPCEIKIDAKVPQEVTAENAALREPCRLIHRFHVEHRGIDLLELTQPETESWQLQQLHVFSYARRPKDAHLRRLEQIQKLFLLGKLFGNYRDACRSINNEIHVNFRKAFPGGTASGSAPAFEDARLWGG